MSDKANEAQNDDQNENNDSFTSDDINDIFQIDEDDDQNEEDEDNDEFSLNLDGNEDDQNNDDDNNDDNDNDDNDNNDDDDSLDFSEDNDDNDSDDFTEKEIASFNKKLDKNFKTSQELKEFLGQKNNDDSKKADDEILEKSQQVIDYYEPLLKLNDEALMRKQFEAVAVQNKKDLNDDDVQYEINEQVEALKDNGTLSLVARNLREDIGKLTDKATADKNSIVTKREEAKKAKEKSDQENLQNAFVDIFNSENFYGIDLDKKRTSKIYPKVNSGKFLDEILSDKKALSELAMMWEHRKEIYGKASGLSYGDGMKAVLDEFKSKQKDKGSSATSRAQRSGGSGGSEASKGGLVADLIFDTVEEDDKN